MQFSGTWVQNILNTKEKNPNGKWSDNIQILHYDIGLLMASSPNHSLLETKANNQCKTDVDLDIQILDYYFDVGALRKWYII